MATSAMSNGSDSGKASLDGSCLRLWRAAVSEYGNGRVRSRMTFSDVGLRNRICA